MIGEYTLSKVVVRIWKDGTIGHPFFGVRVWVEAEPSLIENSVIDAIGQEVNTGLGEVNSRTHDDWINAAIEGAKETLTYLERSSYNKYFFVKITKVIGTEVDTTEDSVKVAASIATWRAIKPNSSEPIPKFDQLENIWTVEFPSPV
ncbi:hypothetical protein [Pseudanabaena sp. UWO310]|uniref:hypothetical protein n=1 Tax=Pseudanabaena sp. UWO310 TaxID=2480795 RepID=UPI001159FFDF|nr:hypothetical protein [Pseudanabaena sp. UWO310]TYQ29937.1 hypothetical protein PseudUWO310_10985 [Pseudanabaena sp. UWO310]